MSAAPVRFTSGGRGYDTRNCAGVTKEAAMEKLGVIGGMGAEATSYYYDQVVPYGGRLRPGTYRHGGAF